MDNQQERLELQSVPVHRLPPGIQDYEDLYFPIDHNQIRSLLGQVLTQVEAMNLQPQNEKAVKAIFTQMLWRWFDEVMENSITSAHGCIAPLKIKDCTCEGESACNRCAVQLPIKLVRIPIVKPLPS
jgi:hypothetical protein